MSSKRLLLLIAVLTLSVLSGGTSRAFGQRLLLDTKIESPARNDNAVTLPEKKPGDAIRFQFFVAGATGRQIQGYTVELSLRGKTFGSYIDAVSGMDPNGGALISGTSGSGNPTLSMLVIPALTVASSGYLGQVTLRVSRALTSSDVLAVASASTAGPGGVQTLDVTQASLTFAATAQCPGDFNDDGSVDFADFVAFARVFGANAGDASYDAGTDMDGSGAVDFADFVAFARVFGTACPVYVPRSVSIPDANLRAVIEDSLGKARGAPITRAEMTALRVLQAPGSGIRDLTGLEHAVNLTGLNLDGNGISDVAALFSLGNLRTLSLQNNRLSGTIPRGLSTLSDLEVLWLGGNRLSGEIPAEMGNLSELGMLALDDNELSGTIPAALGRLSNLGLLNLSNNRLSGAIPGELGSLSSLVWLNLQGNSLSGAIPATLGRLPNLEVLDISRNAGLSGPLPGSFTGLGSLTQLHVGGTALCAPTDDAFQEWLKGISGKHGVVNCSGDRAALEALYNATKGENWTNKTNWLSNTPIGGWHGVTTDANGRVTSLDLPGNKLTGTIPSELGRLTNLVQINLQGNQLSGAIPVEVGNMAKLENLALSENQLSGVLPRELGSLSSLKRLMLYSNRFEGAIPSELGNLSNLLWLQLHTNRLSGAIPRELGNLGNLEILALSGNRLRGELPSELGKLSKLQWLILVNNADLSGPLPDSFAGLAALNTLSVEGTKLCAPTEAAFQTWLRGVANKSGVVNCSGDRAALVALYNATDGANWTNRTNWRSDLPLGEWSGVFTDGAGRVTHLVLPKNRLNGPIPRELGNLSNLQSIGLNGNRLRGELPTELGSLSKLERLILANNADLSGPLPDSFAGLSALNTLSVNGTKLCAPTDAAFQTWLRGVANKSGVVHCSGDRAALVALYNATDGANWTNRTNWLSDRPLGEWRGIFTDGDGRVTHLLLPKNRLNGPIPRELGNLSNLQSIDLTGNLLNGSIPSELGSLSKLELLDLPDNRLIGTIPIELGGLANLRQLVLSGNQLSGTIPGELGSLSKLRAMYLEGNRLTGRIPSELGSLSNLGAMDLSQNAGLSDPMPASFTGLVSLGYLSLSGTQICAPTDAAFQAWLRGVGSKIGVVNCEPEDKAALVALYNATKGANWTNNNNWDSNRPLGEWHGITTDANGRVTHLTLPNNQLSGPIPSQLGNLSNLQILALGNNALTGSIPSSLGNLSNLQHLALGRNALTGSIPSQLGNLSNLQDLYFQYNAGLSGPLPGSFTGLDELTGLFVGGTRLCAPTNAAFQAWLRGIANKQGVVNCTVSKMYWTDWGTDKIQRSNLDGSGVEDLVTSGLSAPKGLALDVGAGKMYWTDFGTDKIQRSNLDGSGVEDLVTSGLSGPDALALDLGAGKMYWTDFGTDKIQRSNLDGSGVEDLVTSGLFSPAGLELDLGADKMYWTDSGTDKIQRANLDGSGVEDLVSSGLLTPVGLALDLGAGKMYWTDWGTEKIQRANLDGSGVEDLVTSGLASPAGLELDLGADKMYWTDEGTKKIRRANLDGSGVEDLVTSGLASPGDLALDLGNPQ